MRIRQAGAVLAFVATALSATASQAGNGKIIAATELYSGPADSFQPVASLSADSILVIYGCDAKFNWCDVGEGDQRGWVPSKALAVIRGGDFVPIRDVAPFAGVRVVEYDQTEYQARHYAGMTLQPETPKQAEPATASPAPAAPSPSASALAAPQTGGVAYSQAMNLVAKALTTPDPAPQASAVRKADEWTGETLSDSSIRSGPGSRYPRIATVRIGAEIVIHGCTARYRWCDIATEGKRGWVYGPLLAVADGNELGPLPSNAKDAGIAIIEFDMEDYHAQHYQGEPWQNQASGGETAAPKDNVQSAEAANAATRVVRLPGPRGQRNLPANANALQAQTGPDGNAPQEAPATGLRRFLPKVFR